MPRRKIEIDDLFRLRTIADADMHPDGSRIVFALTRRDLKKNATYSSLYAVPAKGGRMRRLTRGDHADGKPRFSPDGSKLAFVSNREKSGGLWVLPLDGGEPERITDRDLAVLDYAWSPDGRHFAIVCRPLTERQKLQRDGKTKEIARQPDFQVVDRLSYKMDGGGFRPELPSHIHFVRATGGKTTPLTSGKHDDHEPRFSPDGTRVSFVSNRVKDPDRFNSNLDLYSVGLDGAGLRKITREPGPAYGHTWTPDGKSIVYLGHLGGPGEWSKHNLHVRRVPSGGGKSVDLTPDVDRNCANMLIGDVAGGEFGGPAPLITPDGDGVTFVVTDEGASRLAMVPLAGGEVTYVLGREHTVFGYGYPRNASEGWFVAGSLTNPGDVYALPAGRQPKRLTKVNDAVLRGLDIVEPEEVRIRRKGCDVHGWILRPPAFRKGRRYPAILEVHGGPHVGYGRVFFHEMQLLAARGYVVLMTNPRGSDGYGLAHRTAIQADWGNLDAKDLMAAVDGLLAREPVDRKRLYLTGGSYGGYMTNWLVGHTNRFRAAVTQRSVTNLESFVGSSDIGYNFGSAMFDGQPWEEPERYRKLSPLTYAENVETPLLIIHSEQDLRCPMEQGEQLFVKLKLLGKETEMVRFAGESHGLSRGGRPQNRAERLRRILDWFRRHGGR